MKDYREKTGVPEEEGALPPDAFGLTVRVASAGPAPCRPQTAALQRVTSEPAPSSLRVCVSGSGSTRSAHPRCDQRGTIPHVSLALENNVRLLLSGARFRVRLWGPVA